MKKLKQIVFSLCIIGIISSIALYLYGENGPYYNTTPLKSSFSFASSSAQTFSFTVERTEDYMIEIHLSNECSRDKIESILGKYVGSGKGAPIDVSWEIKDKNKIIASGSNKEYGYSHIFSRDYTGITIGSFLAHRNTEYTLSLFVNSVASEWDNCMPQIKVALHPSDLEYLLCYQILSVLIFVPSAIVLIIIALFSIIKRKVKNKDV